MNELELIYRKNPDLAARVIKGEAYVVVPETNMMYILNEPGAVLWTRLAIPASARDLVVALCEEFEVTETEAEHDVKDFLEEMTNVDLVRGG